MITEDQLEQLCLDWFKAIGYDTVNGYDIAPDGEHPERIDYRQVVLFDRLLSTVGWGEERTPTIEGQYLYLLGFLASPQPTWEYLYNLCVIDEPM